MSTKNTDSKSKFKYKITNFQTPKNKNLNVKTNIIQSKIWTNWNKLKKQYLKLNTIFITCKWYQYVTNKHQNQISLQRI